MEKFDANDLVVVPVCRLEEIIGNVVDEKMNFWLSKKREEELQEKRHEEVMLTISECVDKYKVSRSTLYKKIKTGSIPCSRIGAKVLIRKADMEKVFMSGSAS